MKYKPIKRDNVHLKNGWKLTNVNIKIGKSKFVASKHYTAKDLDKLFDKIKPMFVDFVFMKRWMRLILKWN